MTARDEALQNPRNKIRRSFRTFTVNQDTTVEQLSALVESDPCVVMVGTDAVARPLAFVIPNDTDYAASLNQKTSYLDSINFADAYDKFFGTDHTPTTASVTVAVIDSGTLTTHEDLSPNLWTNTGETASNSVDDDSNGYIDDVNGWNFADPSARNPDPQTWPGSYAGEEGHGTHVSGIIGAKGNNSKGVLGIMSDHVQIMGLNVFGDEPSASASDIDNAIVYAVNNGAKVINMSLGGESYAASTETAIRDAVTAGVFVAAAAGNGDSNGYGLVLSSSYGIWPASLAKDVHGMMSVGSFDALTGDRSIFSNCSSTYVEISAPGAYDSSDIVNGGIPSTWNTSTSSYAKKFSGFSIYGTSMASPVVAGAAALAISFYHTKKGSDPTPAQVEDMLLNSGATVSALSSYVKDGKIIDLDALYDYIDGL
jgi:subtilisin family serine protease